MRCIEFPEALLLSDNFFRPLWVGLGVRRLKNVFIVMEWQPSAYKSVLSKRVAALFAQLRDGCGAGNACPLRQRQRCAVPAFAANANACASRALQLAHESLRVELSAVAREPSAEAPAAAAVTASAAASATAST